MTTQPATLDDAQGVVLTVFAQAFDMGMTPGGYSIDTVFDAGQSRRERLVSFDLAAADGTVRTFTATITADDEQE